MSKLTVNAGNQAESGLKRQKIVFLKVETDNPHESLINYIIRKGCHSRKRSASGILLQGHRKDSGQAGMTKKK
jgi:hypothetical protein